MDQNYEHRGLFVVNKNQDDESSNLLINNDLRNNPLNIEELFTAKEEYNGISSNMLNDSTLSKKQMLVGERQTAENLLDIKTKLEKRRMLSKRLIEDIQNKETKRARYEEKLISFSGRLDAAKRVTEEMKMFLAQSESRRTSLGMKEAQLEVEFAAVSQAVNSCKYTDFKLEMGQLNAALKRETRKKLTKMRHISEANSKLKVQAELLSDFESKNNGIKAFELNIQQQFGSNNPWGIKLNKKIFYFGKNKKGPEEEHSTFEDDNTSNHSSPVKIPDFEMSSPEKDQIRSTTDKLSMKNVKESAGKLNSMQDNISENDSPSFKVSSPVRLSEEKKIIPHVDTVQCTNQSKINIGRLEANEAHVPDSLSKNIDNSPLVNKTLSSDSEHFPESKIKKAIATNYLLKNTLSNALQDPYISENELDYLCAAGIDEIKNELGLNNRHLLPVSPLPPSPPPKCPLMPKLKSSRKLTFKDVSSGLSAKNSNSICASNLVPSITELQKEVLSNELFSLDCLSSLQSSELERTNCNKSASNSVVDSKKVKFWSRHLENGGMKICFNIKEPISLKVNPNNWMVSCIFPSSAESVSTSSECNNSNCLHDTLHSEQTLSTVKSKCQIDTDSTNISSTNNAVDEHLNCNNSNKAVIPLTILDELLVSDYSTPVQSSVNTEKSNVISDKSDNFLFDELVTSSSDVCMTQRLRKKVSKQRKVKSLKQSKIYASKKSLETRNNLERRSLNRKLKNSNNVNFKKINPTVNLARQNAFKRKHSRDYSENGVHEKSNGLIERANFKNNKDAKLTESKTLETKLDFKYNDEMSQKQTKLNKSKEVLSLNMEEDVYSVVKNSKKCISMHVNNHEDGSIVNSTTIKGIDNVCGEISINYSESKSCSNENMQSNMLQNVESSLCDVRNSNEMTLDIVPLVKKPVSKAENSNVSSKSGIENHNDHKLQASTNKSAEPSNICNRSEKDIKNQALIDNPLLADSADSGIEIDSEYNLVELNKISCNKNDESILNHKQLLKVDYASILQSGHLENMKSTASYEFNDTIKGSLKLQVDSPKHEVNVPSKNENLFRDNSKLKVVDICNLDLVNDMKGRSLHNTLNESTNEQIKCSNIALTNTLNVKNEVYSAFQDTKEMSNNKVVISDLPRDSFIISEKKAQNLSNSIVSMDTSSLDPIAMEKNSLKLFNNDDFTIQSLPPETEMQNSKNLDTSDQNNKNQLQERKSIGDISLILNNGNMQASKISNKNIIKRVRLNHKYKTLFKKNSPAKNRNVISLDEHLQTAENVIIRTGGEIEKSLNPRISTNHTTSKKEDLVSKVPNLKPMDEKKECEVKQNLKEKLLNNENTSLEEKNSAHKDEKLQNCRQLNDYTLNKMRNIQRQSLCIDKSVVSTDEKPMSKNLTSLNTQNSGNSSSFGKISNGTNNSNIDYCKELLSINNFDSATCSREEENIKNNASTEKIVAQKKNQTKCLKINDISSTKEEILNLNLKQKIDVVNQSEKDISYYEEQLSTDQFASTTFSKEKENVTNDVSSTRKVVEKLNQKQKIDLVEESEKKIDYCDDQLYSDHFDSATSSREKEKVTKEPSSAKKVTNKKNLKKCSKIKDIASTKEKTGKLNRKEKVDTVKQPENNNHPFEATFNALEELKFSDIHSKLHVHNLVTVLINPLYSPHIENISFYLAKYLLNSRRNPLLTYSLTLDKSVMMPFIEKCIVNALVQMSMKMKSYLQGLLKYISGALFYFIVLKAKNCVYGLSSCCRVFADICRIMKDKRSPFLLCCKLVRINHAYSPFLIATVVGIWPEIFQVNNSSSDIEKLFLKYLFLVMNGRKSTNILTEVQWKQCSSVFSEFHDKSYTPEAKENFELLKKYVEVILNEDKLDADSFVVTALAVLLGTQNGSEWTKEHLLNNFIIPALTKYSQEIPNESAFKFFCYLYADVCCIWPKGLYDEKLLKNMFTCSKRKLEQVPACDKFDFHYVPITVACSLLKIKTVIKEVIPNWVFAWATKYEIIQKNSFQCQDFSFILQQRYVSLRSHVSFEECFYMKQHLLSSELLRDL